MRLPHLFEGSIRKHEMIAPSRLATMDIHRGLLYISHTMFSFPGLAEPVPYLSTINQDIEELYGQAEMAGICTYANNSTTPYY